MTRRITCYVVFVTLIWGAHTQNEEKTRDNMFKSNMTRNDFSKLLSSLIKLNEQRVSVLQKLYKLEDYGVLSEVLRTGDSKPETGKGNPNNLFLIVMSKGAVDARTIVKKYQKLRDNGVEPLAEDEQHTENTDEIIHDLLGLVTMEDNETLTRRNNEDSSDSASIERESDEDYGIKEKFKSQVRDKDNKKHHGYDKNKTKRHKSKPKDEEQTGKHKALRERDERVKVKKELRDRCVSEIDNKIVKCVIACRRTQQDVCSRLACSDRSRSELRSECDNSCKGTFVPEAC